MASRPLSVIAAVRKPEDVEDVAETRGQLANAKYVAARHWEALVDSRKLCTQVSDAHAELQSELQRSAQKLRVLEQELKALNKEHKECVLAYASVEGSSCNIERHLRQEIEAADMLRGKMQQGYKEQLSEQQGLVAEHRQENKCLMEDKVALIEEVARLRRQLNIVQTTQATPTGPGNMARSVSIGGATSTPSADSPTWGFASLSAPDSPMFPSSVASHGSDVFDCLMQDVVRVAQELSKGDNLVQTPRATPAGPANMAAPPFGSTPSCQQRAMLSTPHPLPVYQEGQVIVHRVFEPKARGRHVRVHGSNPRRVTLRRRPARSNHRVMDSKPGSWHVRVHGSNARKVTFRQQAAWQRYFLAAPRAHWQGLQSSPCPGDLLKVTVRGLPVTKQHPSSPLEVASSSAELNAGAAASTSNSPTPSVSPVGTLYAAFLSGVPTPMADVEALITMGPSPDSPKGTPLVNRSQRPTLANPSNKLNPQARCLSMVGMPSTLSAESATFDVASLLGADSPMSIGGTAWSSSADSFTSGVASLSDAGSPMSSSSVATHDSDVFEGV
ncbi:TPA: hypothetical protein ACH3X3_001108 [Trebouxia sp. C0006]